MTDTPDYSQYSLPELIDARRNIDEHAWSERVKELDRQIELRQRQTGRNAEPDESVFDRISRRAIGLYLFLSGASSIVLTVELGLNSQFNLSYIFPLCLYSSMAIGGVLLMRRSRAGLLISVIAMSFQMPVFQIGRLTYVVTAVPVLELQLWPQFGITFGFTNFWNVAWESASQPPYIGANVWAGVAVMLLGSQIDRLQKAPQRLVRRSRAPAS